MPEQDIIEIMATVTKDCPPHLLKFVGYGSTVFSVLCTVHRCDKCGHEEWIPMPDEREKRRE